MRVNNEMIQKTQHKNEIFSIILTDRKMQKI